MALRGLQLKTVPNRTCIGCRVVDAQANLVRVAASGDRLIVSRTAPGRGVYLHARAACIAGAARGGFARSLRRSVMPEDVKRVVAELSPTDDNQERNRSTPDAGSNT